MYLVFYAFDHLNSIPRIDIFNNCRNIQFFSKTFTMQSTSYDMALMFYELSNKIDVE